jgi:thiol-disulfide isomerase/thioredoxin
MKRLASSLRDDLMRLFAHTTRSYQIGCEIFRRDKSENLFLAVGAFCSLCLNLSGAPPRARPAPFTMNSVVSSLRVVVAFSPGRARQNSTLGARSASAFGGSKQRINASVGGSRNLKKITAPRRSLPVVVHALGRADEREPGWWDTPATSNFIDVTSEQELRDVMRAAYGNERASTLLVVEFYGKWCNSCRRLYPALKKLAKREQDVLFVKIDFDECKELCRKLGVVKLPYFHVYNGSGSRLADFASSLDPVKFKRLTDAIETNKSMRCALRQGDTNNSGGEKDTESSDNSPSVVKLHHVTVNWRGGGEHVMIAGDVAGGWTHTLSLSKRKNSDEGDAQGSNQGPNEASTNNPMDSHPTHSVTAILPTGTFRFKFVVDGEWLTEPSYPTVCDGDANKNNELFVGAASWPFEWVRVPSASPAGPVGRIENVPVALTDVTTTDAVVKPMHTNLSNSPVSKQSGNDVMDHRRSPLAAPVSPGVAKIEAENAKRASSKPFDENVKPPVAKAKMPPFEPSIRLPTVSSDAATRPYEPVEASPFPPAVPTSERSYTDSEQSEQAPTEKPQPQPFEIKKIKVDAGDFSTKSEHDKKVDEERAQAFRSLEFRRKEERKQDKFMAVKPLGPYSAIGLAPSRAPVPVATLAASKAELLTLEDRVKRLEQVLENHGIGLEDQWLREG